MLLLLGFSFLSGLATMLMPCIWPILPIVLSSSSGKGKMRPLALTLGIMISFAFFTLATSYLVRIFHFDPNIFRLFAVIVIAFFGLSMIIPKLTQLTEVFFSKLSNVWGTRGQQNNGFGGGFLSGLSLGIVWTPCSGPILASIAALTATGQVNSTVILMTITYVLGVGIPLLAFSIGGQRFITNTRFLSAYTGRIQQAFGVIMILTAVAIYTNFDKTIQLNLLNHFPGLSKSITFAENDALKIQLDNLKGGKPSTVQSSSLENQGSAPDFIGITKWLNTDGPIKISDLKGKVVLVDFWTYTCINCIRTLPHVTSWYDKYKDQGFIVIGVHTPEFEFEKKTENVLVAIKQYNIHYPVAQDNNYATWENYNNRYWPAEYLIDAKGNIRKTHFGEGEYDETERAIQALLKEAGNEVSGGVTNLPDDTPKSRYSPETYLGSDRMQYLYPNGSVGNGTQSFSLSQNILLNSFSFGGRWTITEKYAITGSDSVLEYNFISDKVFLVLRPGINPISSGAKVKVLIDGRIPDEKSAGDDVKDGIVTINSDRLYNLINLHGIAGKHILRLEFQSPGIEAYAFTFG